MKKILKPLLWTAVGMAGVTVALVVSLLIWAAATAPKVDPSDVSPDGYRTTVLDMDGNEILALAGEASNRVYVTLDQIPEEVQKAFIAIEDERFYQHHGVDLRSVLRALWRDVTGGRMEGASTITQQLLKNNVFTDWTAEQKTTEKVRRKLQEQYLALKLERDASKEWILENYLNTINLGGGAWGVETAAQRYFGKDVSRLTLSEAAVLAAIPKSPTGYNPLKNPEANSTRRLLVLNKMLEQNMITQQAYDAAAADDVYARISENNAAYTAEVFSYFEDALIYEVLEDLMTRYGYSEEDAWRVIYRGGLTISSTQDTDLQTICEEEINNDRSYYATDAQATVVMLDPATGAVRAIVGGRGEKTGSLTLNRATTAVRQPGSTIKVVGEYAAALEQGATLATVYDDAPYEYSNGTGIRNASGTYNGMTTIRRAITESQNVVALKCFQQVGIDAVWDSLQTFGLEHLTSADRVEALALGGTGNGVTNLEMTAAYGAIANGGVYLEPHYYTKVLDREGKLLLENEVEEHRTVSTGTAALLTYAMQDVLTKGTGTAARFSGMSLAGKSGTTSDLRDLWFVGYSPYYACGVWGGYDDCSPQSSSAYVKTIWKAVMERAHKGLENRSFDFGVQTTECEICTKCGNLAVEGLCSKTVQGNATVKERFLPGTEPLTACDCHVAVQLCADSGEKAGFYCRNKEEKVYLVTGTAGTADETAALEYVFADDETCSQHQHWWSILFPGNSEDEPQDAPESNPHSRPGNQIPVVPEQPHGWNTWWDDLLGWW